MFIIVTNFGRYFYYCNKSWSLCLLLLQMLVTIFIIVTKVGHYVCYCNNMLFTMFRKKLIQNAHLLNKYLFFCVVLS